MDRQKTNKKIKKINRERSKKKLERRKEFVCKECPKLLLRFKCIGRQTHRFVTSIFSIQRARKLPMPEL